MSSLGGASLSLLALHSLTLISCMSYLKSCVAVREMLILYLGELRAKRVWLAGGRARTVALPGGASCSTPARPLHPAGSFSTHLVGGEEEEPPLTPTLISWKSRSGEVLGPVA